MGCRTCCRVSCQWAGDPAVQHAAQGQNAIAQVAEQAIRKTVEWQRGPTCSTAEWAVTSPYPTVVTVVIAKYSDTTHCLICDASVRSAPPAAHSHFSCKVYTVCLLWCRAQSGRVRLHVARGNNGGFGRRVAATSLGKTSSHASGQQRGQQ